MFVPCAIGGIINEQTIEQLQVKAIVGAANNQLLHIDLATILKEKGILYAPDYAVSCGGIIQGVKLNFRTSKLPIKTLRKPCILASTSSLYIRIG